MRRLLPALVVPVIAFACADRYREEKASPPTSDSPDATTVAQPGERGGPCNAGRCLTGLTCIDNLCVLLRSEEAGADAATDELDASAAESGVPPPLTCGELPAPASSPTIHCPPTAECHVGEKCCTANGRCSNCDETQPTIACTSRRHCPANQVCCLKTRNVCSGGKLVDPVQCCSPDVRDAFVLCDSESVDLCGSGKACRSVKMVTETGSIELGFCLPERP